MVKIREDLIGVTIVRDDTGRDIVLAAGDEIPKGVTVGEHLITGEPVESAEQPERKIPAKGGPGSSAKAWREYASAQAAERGLNIDIPEDASKADIIEALESAGIPTE